MLTKKITALVILSLALLSGFAIPQTSASAQRIVADVTLWDKQIGEGPSFETNGAVADLSKVRFNDRASAIQVNNGQKWRFYSEKNFKGQYIRPLAELKFVSQPQFIVIDTCNQANSQSKSSPSIAITTG